MFTALIIENPRDENMISAAMALFCSANVREHRRAVRAGASNVGAHDRGFFNLAETRDTPKAVAFRGAQSRK